MNPLLYDYLAESSARFPDKAALHFKDSSLSFRELDIQSSALASFLAQHRVKKGDRIGILLDKSMEAIVSIFGILKSGSCYVPLDPLAPGARLAALVDDCRLKWLISGSSKISLIEDFCTNSKFLENVLLIDEDRREAELRLHPMRIYFRDDIVGTASTAAGLACSRPSPEDLAYILYTSGSTGQPKGVMISHGAAAAFVEWSVDAFELDYKDVFSAHAPLHFDLSIFDIFTGIAAGATIHLIPPGWTTFPATIADFIEKNGITTWYSVPSALVQLVLHGKLDQRRFRALKRVLFAGEVFPSKYLRQLMVFLPGVSFYNLYGPTETNVVTFHHVTELPDPTTDIPLGIPCRDVNMLMVSESGAQSQEGEVGELYISGPTLMRGYWQDSQKTAAVLVGNPIDETDPTTYYRTGDLVHLGANGLLIYHGRNDMMIKTRGYRVELGEVETAISAHGKIKECAATAIPSDEFGNLIKALLVLESDAEISIEDIRRFCSERLPSYMIPSAIEIIESLPRTSTGKINRSALAADEP